MNSTNPHESKVYPLIYQSSFSVECYLTFDIYLDSIEVHSSRLFLKLPFICAY